MGKSFRRDQSYLIDELFDQLESLESLCDKFRGGTLTVYKSMSVVVRTLLIGSSGFPPLIDPILPDARFFPLCFRPSRRLRSGFEAPAELVVTTDAGGALHYSAGSVMPYLGIKEGGVILSRLGPIGGDVLRRTRVSRLFDPLGERLSSSSWLDQPFLRAEWSLRSFLRCVAHKDGGAHVERDPQLVVMQDFGNIHWHLLGDIAHYVHGELACQLRQQFPSHRRIVR